MACPYCRATIDLGRRGHPQPPGATPSARPRSGGPIAAALFLLVVAGIAVAVLLPTSSQAPAPAPSPAVVTATVVPKPIEAPPEPLLVPPPEPPPATGSTDGAVGVMSPTVPSSEPTPAPPPDDAPPPRSAYQTLQGCFARTSQPSAVSGDGLATVQLALRVAGAGTEITSVGTVRRFTMDYVLDLPGASTWRLPVTVDTAPAAEVATTRFAIALAAADDVLVVASQNVVTGWSLVERRLSWSIPLGGRLPTDGPAESSLSVDCQRLSVQRGLVTIPRESMRALRVRASDGTVR